MSEEYGWGDLLKDQVKVIARLRRFEKEAGSVEVKDRVHSIAKDLERIIERISDVLEIHVDVEFKEDGSVRNLIIVNQSTSARLIDEGVEK